LLQKYLRIIILNISVLEFFFSEIYSLAALGGHKARGCHNHKMPGIKCQNHKINYNIMVLWFLDTPEDDFFKSKHVALT
jgi:hypothetical protein